MKLPKFMYYKRWMLTRITRTVNVSSKLTVTKHIWTNLLVSNVDEETVVGMKLLANETAAERGYCNDREYRGATWTRELYKLRSDSSPYEKMSPGADATRYRKKSKAERAQRLLDAVYAVDEAWQQDIQTARLKEELENEREMMIEKRGRPRQYLGEGSLTDMEMLDYLIWYEQVRAPHNETGVHKSQLEHFRCKFREIMDGSSFLRDLALGTLADDIDSYVLIWTQEGLEGARLTGGLLKRFSLFLHEVDDALTEARISQFEITLPQKSPDLSFA